MRLKMGTEIFKGYADGTITPVPRHLANVWCSMKTDGEEHDYYGLLSEEKITSHNSYNPSYCCLGIKHDCPLNVNGGYCAAFNCQYKVQQDNGCV